MKSEVIGTQIKNVCEKELQSFDAIPLFDAILGPNKITLLKQTTQMKETFAEVRRARHLYKKLLLNLLRG